MCCQSRWNKHACNLPVQSHTILQHSHSVTFKHWTATVECWLLMLQFWQGTGMWLTGSDWAFHSDCPSPPEEEGLCSIRISIADINFCFYIWDVSAWVDLTNHRRNARWKTLFLKCLHEVLNSFWAAHFTFERETFWPPTLHNSSQWEEVSDNLNRMAPKFLSSGTPSVFRDTECLTRACLSFDWAIFWPRLWGLRGRRESTMAPFDSPPMGS